MGFKLDAARMHAEHDDSAAMALFAGHGELEAINTPQALASACIRHQADLAQGNVVVEQLHLFALTVTLDQQQGAFANAMAMPEPGREGAYYHQHEQVAKGQH